MIKDTIYYLKSKGKEVIFDAEHFFDGYKENENYAMKTIETAIEAGADWVVLCDTNGGSLPSEIAEIVKKVTSIFNVPIGIHCHEDGGMAVANTLVAVENGALQVQGTINGYGERCGNANLCTIIPNLKFKMKKDCVFEDKIRELTSLSRYISEIANLPHNEHLPYVGNSAFAHKGGMHIDAVYKNSKSFEHISPELVGNERKILMSEVSGKSTILSKIQKEAPWVTKNSKEVQEIIDKLKKLEHEGYQFEGAESSFILLVKRALGKGKEFFSVKDFNIICQEKYNGEYNSLATIKVEVDGLEKLTVAEGDGPVNAIDTALRKALESFYPALKRVRLTDYKVRVLGSNEATAAKVRVHIESTDGENVWGNVGVSSNIIVASWIALVDSIEYFLYKEMEQQGGDNNGHDDDTENSGCSCRA
jgi:2-isopropylmalate synthase